MTVSNSGDVVVDHAQTPIKDVANACHNGNLGSATVSIYDTAWLATVTKEID